MDKILIAEDDISLRTLIKSYLKDYEDKFETIAVENGLEAIKTLQNEVVSLLVTDLKMPKVEGIVLLAYMNRNFPKIPCIVMTSMRKPLLKKKLKEDVLHYIEKPFRSEEMIQVITSALNQDMLDESLQGISIVSFLELVQMDRKTCVCEVELPDNQKGSFYFKDGVLFDAVCGEFEGEEAALKIMQTECAIMNFQEPLKKEMEQLIRKELKELVTESLWFSG